MTMPLDRFRTVGDRLKELNQELQRYLMRKLQLTISKRLMDYGIHPPTNYFPLIVPEALLIEPTESESKETLDNFVDVMKKIATEAKEQPELLQSAPHVTPVGRVDEVLAAKQLVLCCRPIPEFSE